MRIIYNNATDRATLTASSTAGALAATALQNDYKSRIWRSTGASATLTLEWPTAEKIAGAVLAFTRLTATATVRMRGYTNIADAVPALDTGSVLAAPGATLGEGYYAGSVYADVWATAPVTVRKLVIDVVDTASPDGYIQAGRLIVGDCLVPSIGADYGAAISPVDTSVQSRNAADDQMVEAGQTHSKLTFTLGKMAPADRDGLWRILRGNGKSRPVYISVAAGDTDQTLAQMLQIYGRLVSIPSMALPSFRIASASLDVEEI